MPSIPPPLRLVISLFHSVAKPRSHLSKTFYLPPFQQTHPKISTPRSPPLPYSLTDAKAMTLEELKAHIADHDEKYGVPDPDDPESTESSENETSARENPGGTSFGPDPHRSTGPRTPAGKAISAQNATKHGCRSKMLFLRDEDPAEYEALYQGWWNKYQPSDHGEEALVKQLIDNHWFLLRTTKRIDQVDQEMPENAYYWSANDEMRFNNFTRYKLAAERVFYKSFRVLETYFQNCTRAEIDALKADLIRLKIQAEAAGKSREPKCRTPESADPPPAPPCVQPNPPQAGYDATAHEPEIISGDPSASTSRTIPPNPDPIAGPRIRPL